MRFGPQVYDNQRMREIKRSALVAQPPSRLFALINDIESYPRFIPWCTHAKVESRSEREIVATIGVQRGPLQSEFTTRNVLEPDRRILMHLVSGPFKMLEGEWLLSPITAPLAGPAPRAVGNSVRARVQSSTDHEIRVQKSADCRAVRAEVRRDGIITYGCFHCSSARFAPMTESGCKRCMVAYATRERQYLWAVDIATDATIADAIEAARQLADQPDLPWDTATVGIFGESRERTDLPQEGDRIEIYRPLASDPRDRRRERVQRATAKGRRKVNGPVRLQVSLYDRKL